MDGDSFFPILFWLMEAKGDARVAVSLMEFFGSKDWAFCCGDAPKSVSFVIILARVVL